MVVESEAKAQQFAEAARELAMAAFDEANSGASNREVLAGERKQGLISHLTARN